MFIQVSKIWQIFLEYRGRKFPGGGGWRFPRNSCKRGISSKCSLRGTSWIMASTRRNLFCFGGSVSRVFWYIKKPYKTSFYPSPSPSNGTYRLMALLFFSWTGKSFKVLENGLCRVIKDSVVPVRPIGFETINGQSHCWAYFGIPYLSCLCLSPRCKWHLLVRLRVVCGGTKRRFE
jgi:hypothetical protein